ncbi:hypothetical protein MPH_01629 [Macrophomina phaseolina MS6]|uniref:Uncharacterized protein n=1 Tax=Macrophomina phaseolina (strain MS6) TaxID=1126212 RepID=K2S832_MACPH|nr:hypothetical protein MPH_01629 [Macrophomina phaseolina MS6]
MRTSYRWPGVRLASRYQWSRPRGASSEGNATGRKVRKTWAEGERLVRRRSCRPGRTLGTATAGGATKTVFSTFARVEGNKTAKKVRMARQRRGAAGSIFNAWVDRLDRSTCSGGHGELVNVVDRLTLFGLTICRTAQARLFSVRSNRQSPSFSEITRSTSAAVSRDKRLKMHFEASYIVKNPCLLFHTLPARQAAPAPASVGGCGELSTSSSTSNKFGQ